MARCHRPSQRSNLPRSASSARRRAKKAGVVVKPTPTPDGLREAVASRVLTADDRRDAACLLHKHQKEGQQTVARAEKREVRLRDMSALRESLRIQRRQLWKTFNTQSGDTDGDAPGPWSVCRGWRR